MATLEVQIEHGQGENVLFAGFSPERDSPEFKALTAAHFLIPDPDGGAAYRVQTEKTGESVKSTVSIPFVPLPPQPGRHTLTLPSVPIAISRASGEVVRLCTSPHDIVVEDPIANLVEPKPKENPEARRQLEHWSTLKHITYAALFALILGALLAFLISKFLRRPKAAPPPPPPRPPWEVAMEQLFDIRNANLITAGRFDDHFDRVSDTVREYLGRRFGFDGLETTTREMLQILRAYRPSIAVLPQIEAFLRKADLVKFARQTPSELECEQSLALAEELISRTIPGPGEDRQPNADAKAAPFQSTASTPQQGALQAPAEQGADTTVWLCATEPAPKPGLLWHDRRPRPAHYSRRTVETPQERERMWDRVRTAARLET